eukprot:2523969-Pleurochrysis_carterae.AAC.2
MNRWVIDALHVYRCAGARQQAWRTSWPALPRSCGTCYGSAIRALVIKRTDTYCRHAHVPDYSRLKALSGC